MKIDGQHYRSIWLDDKDDVSIIDQTRLPHEFKTRILHTADDAALAIRDMWVRGAPLIGATAAWGMALAMREDSSDTSLQQAAEKLLATRPTAVNLRWAIDTMLARLGPLPQHQRTEAAQTAASEICDADVATNSQIGDHGKTIIETLWQALQRPINILTHCNAGWLATVDWGTAWELKAHGVPHHVIVDNAGGHLMQHGEVDLCIVGSDRTTAAGDVCNKIGTYLKALAASDNGIPFYVALPGSTIDWTISDGLRDIPIEERDAREVTHIQGKLENGDISSVQLPPDGSPARNPAFDVTPARLVTGLIMERGACAATPAALAALYPEYASNEGK